MSRVKVEICAEELEKLAGLMCTKEEAAANFGITRQALHRRMKEESDGGQELREAWESGRNFGRISLRRLMWMQAEGGSVSMAIWLSKNILGYTDKTQVETSGPGGGPIPFSFAMSNDNRDGVVAEIAKEIQEVSTNGSPRL